MMHRREQQAQGAALRERGGGRGEQGRKGRALCLGEGLICEALSDLREPAEQRVQHGVGFGHSCQAFGEHLVEGSSKALLQARSSSGNRGAPLHGSVAAARLLLVLAGAGWCWLLWVWCYWWCTV